MSVVITDLTEVTALSAKLGVTAKIVQQEIDSVVSKWSWQLVREARKIVPVDTGALKSSIRYYPSEGVVRAVGGAGGREYATFVEYGTSRMGAQPFMRPSVAKIRKPFYDDVGRVATDLLNVSTVRQTSRLKQRWSTR